MTILITGASGLLGSDISHHAILTGHNVIKHCNQTRTGFTAANLTTPEGIKEICNTDWDVIIHCAAIKDPEQCEKESNFTYKINVDATAQLAEFAAQHNRKMVFISTDFVFDGTNAPYNEQSIPSPLNQYGMQKAEAEKAVIAASKDHLILRVPILYGIAAGLDKSLLITSSLKAINSKKSCWLDTRIVRYPTYTGDVAKATLLLLKKQAKGIFHISGQDKTSKYGICKTIADILGKSTGHIEARQSNPTREANRPEDAHLAMEQLKRFGFSIEKPFHERLKEILSELPG